MKNISEKQFNELSKQAYMDSSNSRKANMIINQTLFYNKMNIM